VLALAIPILVSMLALAIAPGVPAIRWRLHRCATPQGMARRHFRDRRILPVLGGALCAGAGPPTNPVLNRF